MVVLEDDVVLNKNWSLELQRLIHPDEGMLLLGWNLDSMLRAEFGHGQEIISLFEPAYPSEKALQAIVNSNDVRKSKRLRNCFGLPGYWLHPAMANNLLNRITQLASLPLALGRGFPEITINGIDGLLNLHYQEINAKVIIPPLTLAINNPLTSLTKTAPNKLGQKDT